MNRLVIAALSASLAAGSSVAQAVDARSDSKGAPQAIAGAIADSSRPAADSERDANRKPLETLTFIGMKPGDKVADYAAGSGYFTRLFQDIVQPSGHVYSVVPSGLYQYPNIVKGTADILSYAAAHPNVTFLFGSVTDTVRYPEKLDVFWISQNYHDLHDSFMGPADMGVFNKAVFDSLKPGGLYVVLDHTAAPGAPADVTDTLHRIDPAVVRKEVEAAGFVFVGESKILANPADPRTAGVFDKSIRGHTDQFIYKFQRPRKPG
jgi:predicted methyltransferase